MRSPVDVYELIDDDIVKETKLRPRARVVVLVAPDDTSHDFMITVAQNAGLNVQLVRDRQTANELLTQPGWQ